MRVRGILRLMLAPTLPDLSKLDREALRALLLAEHQERIATHQQLLQREQQLLRRESEIEHLKLLLSQLRRMQFGRKSEKLERQIEQLELRLEDLQQAQAGEETPHCGERPATEPSQPTGKAKPARRPLPEHLPRQTQTHVPKHSVCPDCGGEFSPVQRRCFGDVGVRAGLLSGDTSCTTEAELPTLRTDRASSSAEPADFCARPGWAGSAGACAGFQVCRSSSPLPAMQMMSGTASNWRDLTLADWVGGTSALLDPLVEALRRYVMGGEAARL